MEQRDKLKRHFFMVVAIVAFLMTLLGQLLLYPLMFYLNSVISDAGILFLIRYSTFLGIWPVTLLYCRFAEKDTFKKIGSAKRGGPKGNTVKHLLIGLLIGIGVNAICALVAYLHGDLVFSFSSFDFMYLAVGLVAVFIQSGAEELVDRGYMYDVLRSRYGVIFAIIANAAFFAAMHLGNQGLTVLAVLQLILVSVVMSLFVWKYDSLWMAMGFHTGWNYTQSLLLGLPNSGVVSEKALLKLDAASDSIFYSASFGLEGGMTIILMFVAAGLYILLIAKRKR